MFTMLPTSLLLLSLQLLGSLPTAQAGSWAAPAALSEQVNGVCPLWADINCQSISEPNYCCTEGYYCAYGGPENHIGCCPNNEVCTGTPPTASTTVYTVTTTVAATTFTTVVAGTTVYVAGGVTEYVGATTTEYVTEGTDTSICSTMTAHGVTSPVTAAGKCGVILVVNGAGRLEDWALGGVIAGANMLGGMLFWLGMI